MSISKETNKTPRKQVLEQIIWHIEHEAYIYYGNREQFMKRRNEAISWLNNLINKE